MTAARAVPDGREDAADGTETALGGPLSLRVYSSPEVHAAVSRLIRDHSTNPTDVREWALGDRDLSDLRRVLDLGCGYGFMAEALAPRLHPRAVITGVDALPVNRAPFLERAQGRGHRASFERLDLTHGLPWPQGSFDLVVSSYSLYFFPQLVTDVSRVLQPDGRFLALTHRETAVEDLLRLAGLPAKDSPFLRILRGFSAENGGALLRRHFRAVETRQYRNSLRFGRQEHEELLSYLHFKVRLLVECSDEGERLCSVFEQGLAERVREVLARGPVRLSKDDMLFWAVGPLSDRPAGRHPGRNGG
jgi:SAM-dependent methyltransferase